MLLKTFTDLLSAPFFQEFEKKNRKDATALSTIKTENFEQRYKRCSGTGKEISYQISGSLVKEGLWLWSIA